MRNTFKKLKYHSKLKSRLTMQQNFKVPRNIYGVNLHIQSEYRKIRTRINFTYGHFSHCAYDHHNQKKLLGEGLINFRILFLKTATLFEFQRIGSKLFHTTIVEGKKEISKKLCQMLKKRMLPTSLVVHAWVLY